MILAGFSIIQCTCHACLPVSLSVSSLSFMTYPHRPSFQFNKQSKRDTEDQRILARHLEEKNDREEARQAAYASRQRVEQGFREAEKSSRSRFGFNRGGSSAGNNGEDGEDLSGTGGSAPKTGRAKWEQGGRYQFEASNSDDELEQELDSNLDEIAGITSRLKILATTAGKEIDAQNKHLDKVSGKVDTLDDKILMNTQYLKRSEFFPPNLLFRFSLLSFLLLYSVLLLYSSSFSGQRK
jgi:hypothetical protein